MFEFPVSASEKTKRLTLERLSPGSSLYSLAYGAWFLRFSDVLYRS